jgi:shikimate dehydrogenase
VGSGATAASAVAALADLGAADVLVLARSTARAQWLVPLGADLGVAVKTRPLDDVDVEVDFTGSGPADLLVSTIPASAQPAYADRLGRMARVVFDVIYDPPVTPLLRAAVVAGSAVVPGLDLLLHQAARQVELMTGVAPAPIEAMRRALL